MCVCVCFVLVIYYAVLYVFSGLAIISRETRDMVILVLLSALCHVAIIVIYHFSTVPWGL